MTTEYVNYAQRPGAQEAARRQLASTALTALIAIVPCGMVFTQYSVREA